MVNEDLPPPPVCMHYHQILQRWRSTTLCEILCSRTNELILSSRQLKVDYVSENGKTLKQEVVVYKDGMYQGVVALLHLLNRTHDNAPQLNFPTWTDETLNCTTMRVII